MPTFVALKNLRTALADADVSLGLAASPLAALSSVPLPLLPDITPFSVLSTSPFCPPPSAVPTSPFLTEERCCNWMATQELEGSSSLGSSGYSPVVSVW